MFNYSTAIQQIDHPTNNGSPNPYHGQFFVVGSVPVNCLDQGGKRIFPTIESAESALREAGIKRYQMPDCTWKEATI
jgi:hypothetical protein